jgi:hypothetical protein
MTDPQMMTLALAIIIPLSMLLYSNSRITEMKETLRAEMATGNSRITDVNTRITDVKETLRAGMTATTETLRAEMAAGFSRMFSEIQSLKADLKIHELEHHHK